MTPNEEITLAIEKHEEVTATVKRGQKWGSWIAGGCGTLIMVPLALRYSAGLFTLFGLEPLGGGEVWLGVFAGFFCFLGSAAMAQVAVGSIGAKLLEKITPGG